MVVVKTDDYEAFTKTLIQRLEADDRVLGLVAAGSMAASDYRPDAWSDHDFWVITQAGAQAHFRTHYDWLPDHKQVVLTFPETTHGLKVVYRSGHLVEYAVFDVDELAVARVNRYRILLDRADLETRLAALQQRTRDEKQTQAPDDAYLFGQFVTNLLVGASRYARGERLSGHTFVKQHALGHLLRLLIRHQAGTQPEQIDNLDPTRRFEQVFPALGPELNACLLLDVPQAAQTLLALAERELRTAPAYPEDAVQAVRQVIERALKAGRDAEIQQALAHDRTIDITTIGRKSGKACRIEIWYHYINGRIFLTGRPGKRDWYANLRANPAFTVHLKESLQADVTARARLITGPGQRRVILGVILNKLGRDRDELGAWMKGSPLVEVTFPQD
ncbi:MAG: nitroreductase/quinone reductase family protein [Anaerolineae bacterium]|nr:nitroreductase/quinone reductase family protein [Anaerolineae bacterium]